MRINFIGRNSSFWYFSNYYFSLEWGYISLYGVNLGRIINICNHNFIENTKCLKSMKKKLYRRMDGEIVYPVSTWEYVGGNFSSCKLCMYSVSVCFYRLYLPSLGTYGHLLGAGMLTSRLLMDCSVSLL